MAKKYTTTRKALGYLAQVCTQSGALTGYKVLVPYNSPAKFAIGSLEFIVKNNAFAYAQGEIPQAWFIDLNAADLAA
jgi:hypothetical protein